MAPETSIYFQVNYVSSLKWRYRYDRFAKKFGDMPEANDCRDLREYKILQGIVGSIFREVVDKRILDIGCGNGGISEFVPS